MTYHIGLIRGTGRCKCWANGHRADTLIVQARRSIDFLSPELWRYMGERQTTKAGLRARIRADVPGFLAGIEDGERFRRVIVD